MLVSTDIVFYRPQNRIPSIMIVEVPSSEKGIHVPNLFSLRSVSWTKEDPHNIVIAKIGIACFLSITLRPYLPSTVSHWLRWYNVVHCTLCSRMG
jgi:hypothetical protein